MRGVPFRLKRVYDPPESEDGRRVLVDRLWPRGLSKQAAALDEWARDLAPSTGLRKWFHANRGEWETFRDRYRAELATQEPALSALSAASRDGPVTLLFAVADRERNHAILLREMLEER